MNDIRSSGRLGTIKGDFRHFWKDLVSFYRLPLRWKKATWGYAAAVIIVFPGLFFLDPHIRMFFAEIHTHFLSQVFGFAHWYGKIHPTLDTFVILYVFGLALRHEKLRIAGWKVFEAFAISGITVTILESTFGRWRPYTGHGSFAFVGFTFGPNAHLSLPSGDVGVAVAYSMILAGFSSNKIWKAYWYLLAVLTCLGRIYHDQHWFSDVVLAAIISVSVGNYVNATFKEEAMLRSAAQ
jgi:membrane-associated phospholipid phosphatase